MVAADSDARISELERLRAQGEDLFAIHYACENLSSPRSTPPGVSAIAIQNVVSAEVFVFSRVDRPSDGEQYVLRSYFEFLRDRATCRLVHWNMNSAHFGFISLANRYAHVFGAEPESSVRIERTFSLAELVAARYGEDFADTAGGRMQNLIALNGLGNRHSLSGKDEADEFAKGGHGIIRASAAEKVDRLCKLTTLLLDGDLETKSAGRRVRFAGATLDSVRVVTGIAERVRDVARQLSRRREERPTLKLKDEYDYQDLFHSLLRLFFGDVRDEAWTPDYAGGSARIDFIVPDFRLAIELKRGGTLDSKTIADQLIVDIERYKVEPRVRHLICLVFDFDGNLENPRGLERDLSKLRQGLSVTVQILDR